MLSHSDRRVFVLKMRLTRGKKKEKKDPRAEATYLLEDRITLISNAFSDSLLYKHDQVSMFIIFSSNCYGWTRWLDSDSMVGLKNNKKKIGI